MHLKTVVTLSAQKGLETVLLGDGTSNFYIGAIDRSCKKTY